MKSLNETPTTSESDTSPSVMTPAGIKDLEYSSEAQLQGANASNKAWPQRREDLTSLMAEIMGIDQSAMNDNATLECLGFDSLSLTELKSEIEGKISFQLENDFDAETTVAALYALFLPGTKSWETKGNHAGNPQTASTAGSSNPQNTARYETIQDQQSDHGSSAGPKIRQSHIVETVLYKIVEDLEILADVNFPKESSYSTPMAIGKTP